MVDGSRLRRRGLVVRSQRLARDEIEDGDELDAAFPGVRAILEAYYSNYVGIDGPKTEGFGSRAAARWLIAECHRAYEERIAAGALPAWGAESR